MIGLNLDNLNLLIRVLKRVESQQLPFNLRKYQDSPKEVKRFREAVDCGTICCALGWLTLSQDFKNLGGRTALFGSPDFSGIQKQKNSFGIAGAAEWLNISLDLATKLFNGAAYSETYYNKPIDDIAVSDVIGKLTALKAIREMHFRKLQSTITQENLSKVWSNHA